MQPGINKRQLSAIFQLKVNFYYLSRKSARNKFSFKFKFSINTVCPYGTNQVNRHQQVQYCKYKTLLSDNCSQKYKQDGIKEKRTHSFQVLDINGSGTELIISARIVAAV